MRWPRTSGQLFGTVRADPDGTNNAVRKKVIVNRSVILTQVRISQRCSGTLRC